VQVYFFLFSYFHSFNTDYFCDFVFVTTHFFLFGDN